MGIIYDILPYPNIPSTGCNAVSLRICQNVQDLENNGDGNNKNRAFYAIVQIIRRRVTTLRNNVILRQRDLSDHTFLIH